MDWDLLVLRSLAASICRYFCLSPTTGFALSRIGCINNEILSQYYLSLPCCLVEKSFAMSMISLLHLRMRKGFFSALLFEKVKKICIDLASDFGL
jgi:hypothetical protein